MRTWGSWLATAAALALAAPSVAGSAPEVAAVEWRRGEPDRLDGALASADPAIRADAVRALGRLARTAAESQQPGPLPAIRSRLLAAAGDPDPGVRRSAADALGYVPGSGPELRAWLGRLTAPTRAFDPAHTGDPLEPVLIRALGRQGGTEDIAHLVAGIARPWPIGDAAAEALGRMARREVPGVRTSAPALAACLSRFEPRVVDACAYALRRVGLADAPADVVDRVERGALSLPTGAARAWALRAVWPRVPAERKEGLLAAALKDADPLVRCTVLDALGRGDVLASRIEPVLNDDHPWPRASAIAALGRLAGSDAIAALEALKPASPWEEASIVRALAEAGRAPDRRRASDPKVPVPVRAVIAELTSDPPTLLGLLKDPSPSVRSAAAGVLQARPEGVPTEAALRLLDSDDLVVRQLAVEVLASRDRAPDPKVATSAGRPASALGADAVRRLVVQLRVDPDPDVLIAGFTTLAAHVATGRKGDLDPRDAAVRDTLLRGLGHPDAPVRLAAEKLRRAINADVGPVPPRDSEGIAGRTSAGEIRSARVRTSIGEFTISLRPDTAPLAVANFAVLADRNFYDGVVFHRVVPGFVAQTGDPRGDGAGGPGWTLPDEVSAEPYQEGAVGMARAAVDTGGSQWFVATSAQPHLTGDYTWFGEVSRGMHVVRRLQPGDQVLDVIIERLPAP